jgi:hypothetical protein
MTDLGPPHHFLGISVSRSTSALFLSQRRYISELIDKAGMTTFYTARTPVDTGSKLDSSRSPLSDPTFYRSLAGALQYATLTNFIFCSAGLSIYA